MAAAALNLVIDARPRGPRGLLAAEVVLDRPVLARLIDQALAAVGPGRTIAVLAGRGQAPDVAPLLADAEPGRVALIEAEPAGRVAVVRTDRLYDGRRLKRAVRLGRDPEAAAFWRLDGPEALAGAEQELNRRLNYQPLGRYWAFPLADRLAAALQPTRVGPNSLTLAAGGLMLLGVATVACGGLGWPGRTATALAFAAALVLDTADGRLARLQGSCSAFGRWLDQVLDELADLALHAAIAWSTFAATGSPAWLVLGMLFASGKYLFLIQSLTGQVLEKASAPAAGEAPRPAPTIRNGSLLRSLKRLVGALGHADLRWHLWIVLAAVGRLDVALAVYACYFPLRALAGIARKGVAHA
ncbi:CDP-alcohol phosphatidyltransferase family protein [Paludisphaera mucosa]|uniref:CDP-alcohol phosphatidyltransferase family protein n=1 Tax=Paludisphaera mucosa TaxID=3030827 RepID=A0ABT6F9E7_9BACT|nr:CDP-alcohol phosphatidyltransferase family protein [Paludisphaera mucosa]MDG3004054.1 CDP-alcohol phosphatidyltransferase family protein [Paludisphaera mucosa]